MMFSPEQLNFFKFSKVVLDEFTVALRGVFASMWDSRIASPPGVPNWDDSVTCLNMFIAKEGGVKKVPNLNKSYKEWDCTALFKATLFAQTFAVPDGSGGVSTLDKLYVRPRGLSAGAFHPSVISPTGNQAETYALALDQLRLLRNTLCHQKNTQNIDKATFDNYIMLAKDAFTALGQDTTRIDEIGMMGKEDFPTAKQQQLEDSLKKEKDAAVKLKQIDDHLTKIESQVKNVGSGMKDVKTEVTDVKTQVKDIRSDMKDVKTDVTHVKTRVEDVGSDVKDVKAEVKDVKTQVEDVGSDVKAVKTEVKDVKTQVKDVGSGLKDVKTKVTDMKAQVKYVVSEVKELKAGLNDMKQAMQAESPIGPQFPKSCIPDKIPHFVGREDECEAILDELTDGDTRLVDVWGPPGFGKTSVAINVAHQLQEMEIPVYFASLRGMKSKDDLVSKLLSIFTDTKQVLDISPSHWLFQSLQRLQNPFVLMLDNADDLLESGDTKQKEQILLFINELLAQCNHIKLLFTTRESLDYLSHKLPIHLERVGVLDEVASSGLVKFLLPDVSDDDCSSIVQVCEQVPLAIRLMCSTMREENISLKEFLEEMKISPLIDVLDNESYPDDARLKIIINKSFERLPVHEKDAFVSLAVFPGWFGIEDAKAVLDLKTALEVKKIIRSLERKSLIDCSENFDFFTVHSFLRSFIDEKRIANPETRDVFFLAQRRFYKYHILVFEMANKNFLTGHSNAALKTFFSRRDSIILSLLNGPKDDQLYREAVEALSGAELFLFAALSDEELLFKTLFDTAVEEARKRQNVDDERKLLAAKAFGHWGWFSTHRQTWDHFAQAGYTDVAHWPAKLLSYFGILQIFCGKSFGRWGWFSTDRQTWDHSLQAGYTDHAHWPAKLLSYFGIHQILSGKVDEGISSLEGSVDHLSSRCDEAVLRVLVFHVLEVSHSRKGDHEKASYFRKLCNIEAETISSRVGGSIALSDFSTPSLEDDTSFFLLKTTLLAFDEKWSGCYPERVQVTTIFAKWVYGIGFESLSKANIVNMIKLCRLLPNFPDEMKAAVESLPTLLSNDCSSALQISNNIEHIDTLCAFMEKVGIGTGSVATAFLKQPLKVCENYLKRLEIDSVKPVEIGSGELTRGHAKMYDLLGIFKRQIRDYSAALNAHQQAIRLREETFGYHIDTVSSLTSIGRVYFEMNNGSKAAESFQTALELRKQLGLYDHVDTAAVYCTLGDNYFTLGSYKKALEAHLLALEFRRNHLGQHPLTGDSLHVVAVLYYRMGKERIHSVTSGHHLAETSLSLVNYREALMFCQQALTIRRELLGDHVDTANSFHVTGEVHYKLNHFFLTVRKLQIASEMRSRLLGTHKDTARSFYLLGLAQDKVGDVAGALKSLQMALLLRKAILGDHPSTANSFNKSGRLNYKIGDYYSARQQFQDAVEVYRRLPDKQKCTATSCYNLALTYFAMKSYPEALEFCQEALTMRLDLFGEHVKTANCFHTLGRIYHKVGDFSSAVEAFQKASDMRSNLLGDSKDTARSYHRLAKARAGMGDLNGALEYLKLASTMRKEIIGEPSDTAKSLNLQDHVFEAQSSGTTSGWKCNII